MGRKLNLSTPTVINTELVPLDESFYIDASGELEQWYYDNNSQYAPNRAITPLTLTPRLSVFDKDTATSYTPSFYTTQWFVNEYDATQGEYVEREIVSAVDGSSPEYIISSNNLIVKKNVSYTRSVTIRCVATYIDPRDSGITYTAQESVILSCNRDATVVYPEVAITSPNARAFNPLTDYKTVEGVEVQDSQFDFDATITNNPAVEEQANDYLAKYEVDGGGTEELVAQDNSITSAPTMQIRYPDGSVEQDATFVKRATAGGTKPTLSGEAVIDSMQGNTIKWNSLIKPIADTTYLEDGLTVVISDNNLFEITGSKTETSSFATVIGNIFAPFVIGHKYAVFNLSTHFSVAAYFGKGYGSFPSSLHDGNNIFVFNSEITTINKLIVYCVSTGGETVTEQIRFRMFDLTDIFGEGNEPETIGEFESWLDANVGTYDYYPYNEGSLIHVNIKSIKTTDSNGDTLDEVPFDITPIKGKLLDENGNPTGNSVVVFPDGLKKAGKAFDEIKVENGVLKAIKKISECDLGTMKWTYRQTGKGTGSGQYPYFHSVTLKSTFKSRGALLCTNYEYVKQGDFDSGIDKCCNSTTFYANRQINVRNLSYSDVESFQAAMSGVIIYYELATPQEYILDPIENPFLYKWFGISNGQEVDVTTMPWYVSGQNTSKLKVDAMFGESINVVLRAQMPDGTLSPSKAYAGVEWKIPDVDTSVLSNNGGAVRSDTTSMAFNTVVNTKGEVLSDARKQQHLRFNWKYRKNTQTTETDAGWGDSVTISASNLRNVKGATSTLASTLVYPYVYILGAWQTSQGTITGYDKPTTTKDGVTYYRIIDD